MSNLSTDRLRELYINSTSNKIKGEINEILESRLDHSIYDQLVGLLS